MAADARDQLIARAGGARTVGELFAKASSRLRRLVPFDGAVWLACDPSTGLPTAPTWAEGMSEFGIEACRRSWELEFTSADVNLYGALARSSTPAAGLRLATADRPARSRRYRDVLEPHGIDDELRCVVRAADGSPWALLALFRAGSPAFDAHECELIAGLSAPLAAAVRNHARPAPEPLTAAEPLGPGLLMFAAGGELVSLNDDAPAWLEEIAGSAGARDACTLELPIAVVGAVMRARAIAERHDRGSARARIRARGGGRWLVCEASCMRSVSGGIGETALVIEPAEPFEVASILALAYQLSARERQITELIARGIGTASIADRLNLSTHTVRGYIKAVFEKVGVSSRGELVAKLFADHYAPIHFAPHAR
jgi:DNA-binding CsgD family transcriptional regulator